MGSMLVMTIVFVIVIGGFNGNSQISVPTYFDHSIQNQEEVLDHLNESTTGFEFFETDEESVREKVALGEYSYAVKMMQDDYRILTMTEGSNIQSVDQVLRQYMTSENLLNEASAQADDPEAFKERVSELRLTPPVSVTSIDAGSGDTTGYNQKLQTLFGMTLFFSLYTIMFSLGKIALEKQTGTMNRIILSPVKKWQVYLGYMGYSFLIGFSQILFVVLLFKYGFGFEVGDQMLAIVLTIACFVFAIVSLSMLILGLIKSYQQLNAVIPIVTVSMAMIGGAYWPLDIVTNDILLTIARIDPITYAMEALTSVSMYDNGISAIYDSLAILVLIGVLCMGIGVNLMERKA